MEERAGVASGIRTVLNCLISSFLVLASAKSGAQAGNYSIAAGNGNLTYTETIRITGSCPASPPPTSNYQSITQTSFSSFAFNGQALSGTLSYVSVPNPNSNCPPTGWQSPVPFPLTGSNYYVFFSPSLSGPGSANLDALLLMAYPNPVTYGNSVQFQAEEQFPYATGTVTFKEGSTTLGSANLAGTMNEDSAYYSTSALSAGSHAITAFYSGNHPSVTATVTLNVTQAPQSINFTSPPPPTVMYGVSPISISATGGGSGNPVVFSVLSGPGLISGSTLTVTGTGTIQIAANQAGNSNYLAAPQVTRSVTVNRAPQAINFTAPPSPVTYGVAPISLSATGGGSGNPVVFSVLSGPGSISGSTLTVTGVGTIQVAANQAGNSNYLAAPQVTQSVAVTQASQSINFTAPPSPVMYGTGPISLSANGGGSGNPVIFSLLSGPGSISGSTLTVTGVGTIQVAANQAGNSNYLAAPQVTRSIAVNQGTQSINFTAPPSPVTYGVSPISLSAGGGGSGNPIVFSVLSGPGSISGSTLTITGVGTIQVAANQAGNSNYLAAPQVTRSVAVNQATQSINFTAPPSPVTYGISPISLSATGGGSGNPIVFSVLSGPGSISGSTLTVTGVGTIQIAANQAGNSNYLAAPQTTRSIAVGQATLTVTANNTSRSYGASNPSFTASYSGFLNGDTQSVLSGSPSLTTSATKLSSVGNYTIAVAAGSLSASNYSFNFVNGTLIVTQAALTVTANDVSRNYGTSNPSFTASYSGFLNDDTQSVVSGSPGLTTPATTSSSVGTYPIIPSTGSLSAANYSFIFANGTLSITQATPIITWPNPTSVPAGTILSELQLNATSNARGAFSYSPPKGTALIVGTTTLSATFTPEDQTDYSQASATASIVVTSGTTQDHGTVTLSVDSGSGLATIASTSYSAGAIPSSIAEGLSAGVQSTSPVNVVAIGDQIFIIAKTPGSLSNYPFVLQTSDWDRTNFPEQPSFAYPAVSDRLDGGQDASTGGGIVYKYRVNYYPNGNVEAFTDSFNGTYVMGTWGLTYDSLNRLAGAAATQPGNPAPNYCWSYDGFGNRLEQDTSSSPFQAGSGGTTACQGQPSSVSSATYDSHNHATSTNSRGVASYPDIDAAGNMKSDGANWYLYDAEGRICAVASESVPGLLTMTGYIYNADGIRVSKGLISSWDCNPDSNGFVATKDYEIGPNGEPLTEMGRDTDNSIDWQRTYVYASGQLIGTYDPAGLHYRLTDWLGTLRVRTGGTGVIEGRYASLPFGDTNSRSGFEDSHLFTGKERDTESGNDYFGARYYASSMGRMLSPDPSGLFFADRTNPQSLNLYAYVRNNPLAFTDPTGLYCAWEDGTSDDDPRDGGATKKQCKQQGGHWTDASNPCHGMDNCVATFDWNNPQRDKTPTFDPRLDPQLVGVVGALPTQPIVSNVVDPDAQKIQQLADAVKKKTDCAIHSLLKSSSTIALDAVGMVPFGGTAEAVVPVANGAVSSVTSAVQGDTTGSALSTVDMVQGAAVRAVTSPAIGINAPKAIPVVGQGYSALLVGRDILNASGEYANCF